MDRQRAARAVAARRGELDMTQQELASAANVDLKTIGSLERRGTWPIARNRARIERALGWQPGQMNRIADEDEDQPQIPPRLRQDIIDFLGERRAAAVLANMEAYLRGEPPPGTSGPGGGRLGEQAAAS